jgi:hypothetical protein
LVLFTSCDEFPCLPGAVPTTAPPHRLTSFPYHLRRDIPTNIPVPPIRENLILVSPGSPTMSPPTGSGSGKETPRSSDDITTRLDRLEELIRVVTSDLCDVKQQQQGLDVSLIRLEQNVYGSSDGVHAASATNATVAAATSGDQSVAPPPNGGNSRPSDGPRHRGTEGDANDEGLPMAHKIEFPKFDIIDDPLPWLNRCERYFCLRGIPEQRTRTHRSTSSMMHRCGTIGWSSTAVLPRGPILPSSSKFKLDRRSPTAPSVNSLSFGETDWSTTSAHAS